MSGNEQEFCVSTKMGNFVYWEELKPGNYHCGCRKGSEAIWLTVLLVVVYLLRMCTSKLCDSIHKHEWRSLSEGRGCPHFSKFDDAGHETSLDIGFSLSA